MIFRHKDERAGSVAARRSASNSGVAEEASLFRQKAVEDQVKWALK